MSKDTVDITKFSVTELKALAFDELNKIEIAQINLRTINSEIQKRQTIEVPKEEDVA